MILYSDTRKFGRLLLLDHKDACSTTRNEGEKKRIIGSKNQRIILYGVCAVVSLAEEAVDEDEDEDDADEDEDGRGHDWPTAAVGIWTRNDKGSSRGAFASVLAL